jgi:hypothetical protein
VTADCCAGPGPDSFTSATDVLPACAFTLYSVLESSPEDAGSLDLGRRSLPTRRSETSKDTAVLGEQTA